MSDVGGGAKTRFLLSPLVVFASSPNLRLRVSLSSWPAGRAIS